MNRKKRQQLYNSSLWRKRRKHQLAKEPTCRICWERERKITAATESDHIQPWDSTAEFINGSLQSLCKFHHSEKSILFDHANRRKKEKTKLKFFDAE